MTVYYIKLNPVHISEHLNEKYVEIMRNSQKEFVQFLTSQTIDEVRRISVMRSDDALKGLVAARQVKSAGAMISLLDDGICANGRTRCGEGVLVQHRSEDKVRGVRNEYGPVPLSIDGAPDCNRCRFFITGTPFVDGHRMKTNEVSYAAHQSAIRHAELVRKIDEGESQRVSAQRLGASIETRNAERLRAYKQEAKAEADVLCNLLENFHARGETFQLLRALLAKQAREGASAVPVLIYSEEPTFEWGLTPQFEVLDELCHAAKWFQSIRQNGLQRERREKIIQMLVRHGKPPLVALLSEDEANAAVDALTSFMYRRLTKSSVEDVIQGRVTFEDLGINSDIEIALSALKDNSIAILQKALDARTTASKPPRVPLPAPVRAI